MPDSVAGLYSYRNKGAEISIQMRTRDIIVLSATFCCDGTPFPVGYLFSVKIIRLGK